MTDRELKRLSREELLEMLLEQTELCDSLQRKLDEALAKLHDREIIMEHAGTMAEAAIKLSGVFEAADKAAALYLENIKRMERAARGEQADEQSNDGKPLSRGKADDPQQDGGTGEDR